MSENESWQNLNDLVHAGMKKLRKRGVSQAEAFFTSTQTTEVAVRNSEILTQNRISDSGVGFRVAVERDKIGFASTNILNETSIMWAAEKALSIARISSRLNGFALPEPGTQMNVKGLFDQKVREISVEEAIDVAQRIVESAEGLDKRVTAKDGRISYDSSCRGIVNTLGVEAEEPETKATAALWANGEQNGEVTGGCVDFMFKRNADLNPEVIGENVAKMVVSLFKAEPIPSFEGTVVFGPEVVAYQLFNALVDVLNSTNVIADRSAWSNKIGQQVASENLTVTDNAVLESGFASRSFDDEGYPSRKTVLIERGILRSFLHNATTARSLKMENTGNASRYVGGGLDMVRMITGNGYRVKPDIYPSNMIINPGTKSKEQIVSEIDKGVLVESMAGFTQQGSGLISAQLTRAFYLQNGEIKHAIKGGMVSGTAFDWFKQISGVGSDVKQFANAAVPSLRIEHVKVIGA